jgi:murein DD-endopeptidase MepM/ murein hydrolase activator NlpD
MPMNWWSRAGTTIGQAEAESAAPADTPPEPAPTAEPPPPPEPAPARGSAASIFAMLVLALAVALALWAPWREERLALSDYGARPDAAPRATAAAGPALATAPGSGAPAASPSAPRPVEQSRPVGMPIQRSDWIIVRDYIANGGPGNTGAIDIGVVGNRDALGTPVYATHDGTVKVLRNNRVYGNLVAIKNGRWSTTYGYLDRVLVDDGQTVRRGEQIGVLGRTGQATGPQVNYQVWEQVGDGEINRNPMDFIAPR